MYSQHAFAVYPLATQARGARGIVVPAQAYGHDLPAMRKAIEPETRVVFIANPNNPTGTLLAGAEIEAFLQAAPTDVVVVLDEAYNEYLPAAARYDSLPWLARHPQSRHHADLLEGLRARRPARRLRALRSRRSPTC